jgi:hypothetical protein
MDMKEGKDKGDGNITFTPERGVNKYYFSEKIPLDHTISLIEPDNTSRAILMPHINEKIKIDFFPKDEKGYYFELPGSKYAGKKLSFRVCHFKRSAQISIFITCSIVGGTGNGMIMDLTAMVKDIFKDFWPAPKIYGILVLPSAFKRVVYNRNAKGNAYAALKEIDFFMSGNTFKAQYPSGRKVEIKDRLFEDGMLYLLDVKNMGGNSLQGRDQVQELTGQFIATFVTSTVGGAIEENLIDFLKETEAREDYKHIVMNVKKKIDTEGGVGKASMDSLAEALNTLGMMARNPSSEKMLFRREYSLVVRDILDGDGTGDRAQLQNISKERLRDKLDTYVTSSKFRLESDPTLLDRTKISTFLDSMNEKLPEIVVWEVKVNNKIIK